MNCKFWDPTPWIGQNNISQHSFWFFWYLPILFYVGMKNNYLKTSYFDLLGWRNDGLSIGSSWPTWLFQSKKRYSKYRIWKIRRILYSTYTFARVSTNNKHLIQLVSNLLHLPQKSFRFPPPRYKGARLNSSTRINFTNLYCLGICFHHTFFKPFFNAILLYHDIILLKFLLL